MSIVKKSHKGDDGFYYIDEISKRGNIFSKSNLGMYPASFFEHPYYKITSPAQMKYFDDFAREDTNLNYFYYPKVSGERNQDVLNNVYSRIDDTSDKAPDGWCPKSIDPPLGPCATFDFPWTGNLDTVPPPQRPTTTNAPIATTLAVVKNVDPWLIIVILLIAAVALSGIVTNIMAMMGKYQRPL